MKITFLETLEIYKDLNLGSMIPKAKGNKSESYFSAVSCVLRQKGVQIQPEPINKVSFLQILCINLKFFGVWLVYIVVNHSFLH